MVIEKEVIISTKEQTPVKKSPLREIIDPFIHLAKAPRALWAINLSYFIEGLVYFGILTILGKFLSENAGLIDLHAGWVYSGFTGGITFAMFFLGGFSDKIGVRAALAISLLLMVLGRIFVALSGSFDFGTGMGSLMFLMITFGLFIVVIGYGMYQPAAYAGIKKFTDKKTATMGYAMIYALMNLGAFVSGIISPVVRRTFETKYPPNGLSAVFWVYVGLTVLAVVALLVLLTRKTELAAIAKANQTKEADEKQESSVARENINNIPLIVYASLTITTLAIALFWLNNSDGIIGRLRWFLPVISGIFTIIEFLKKRPDHPFWDKRFTFFIFILIPVQTLFAHNWLTLPYYIDRAFSDSFVGENFEFFSNLNPLLIFILTPIIAAITDKVNIYKMMIIGTFVMALPTFLLTAGPNSVLLIAYILIMTIGEAMWQPRFLQWAAEIAPPGKTGAYMGIAQFPWFLTKVVTGLYSGYLLSVYCPKPGEGPQNTSVLWFIYALIAIISPIALMLAKKWMQKKEDNSLN